MEFHDAAENCPKFEFKVIDSYKDCLRRQLSEGLHILRSGTMNRRMEFNDNLICRLEAGTGARMGENELKSELAQRRTFKERIEEFISRKAACINNRNGEIQNEFGSSTKVFDINNVSSACLAPNADMNYSYRSCSEAKAKRKRADMETSTPVHLRRETKLIDLGESPINQDLPEHDSNQDSTNDDGIAGTERAGVSGGVDVIAITPEKEISPNTQNIKLYKGADNLVKAAERSGYIAANDVVGENDTVALEENSMYREFKSRREEENLNDILNGLNLSPWNGEEDNLQRQEKRDKIHIAEASECASVLNGEEDNLQSTSGEGKVVIGNAEEEENSAQQNGEEDKLQAMTGGEGFSSDMLNSSVILGKGAPRNVLESRAIPTGMSPKRKLEISPTTLMSVPRRFSLSGASPSLRMVVDFNKMITPKKNVVNWLEELKKDKLNSPVNDEGKFIKRSTRGGRGNSKVGRRIAATFSGRDSPARKQKLHNNTPQDQPLIKDSLARIKQVPDCGVQCAGNVPDQDVDENGPSAC